MQKLTFSLAIVALFTTLGCGSLRGDRDDSDSDSDEDSEEENDEDDEDDDDDADDGLPIGGGGDDGTLPGGDNGGEDEPSPPPAGGGGGGGTDPAPAPTECPGIPSGGRCAFDADGFVMIETCEDGEVERTICANDHFSPENRCVDTPTGAECVDTVKVTMVEEEPAYFCFGAARDYILVLSDDDVAFAFDADSDDEAVGSWTLEGGLQINVPGFNTTPMFSSDENGIALSLHNLDTGEDCEILGYEAQDAFEAVFDCRATGFAGSDDIVLTLDSFGGVEFFMVEDTAAGTGVENLEVTQRFGGYYVEGERVFLGIDFRPGDFHSTDLSATELRLRANGEIDIEPIGSFTSCTRR